VIFSFDGVDCAAVVRACLLRKALPNARDKDEVLLRSSTTVCERVPAVPAGFIGGVGGISASDSSTGRDVNNFDEELFCTGWIEG
jgi:hypothetical protein